LAPIFFSVSVPLVMVKKISCIAMMMITDDVVVDVDADWFDEHSENLFLCRIFYHQKNTQFVSSQKIKHNKRKRKKE
jgi:hypothetical protein